MNYKVETHVVGQLATNCYMLVNEDTKEIIVVDPGDNADRLSAHIDANNYEVKGILLTHGHFDHIMAVNPLKEKYNCIVGAFSEEDVMLEDPIMSLTARASKGEIIKPDFYYNADDMINLAGFDIKVIYTPGHSIGSACYYVEAIGVLFSGDTLFRGSIGRTDFPTGDHNQMMTSLNDVLMKLPDDVVVYPGHSGSTSIGYERKNNPYIE